MIGSILTRVLVMIFGYAYPAYECYKTVEMNKPSIEQLRFWCQYWILVAVLTVSERIGDTFISWVPMYSEAKLAFYIYLWYPKTMGTRYVYDSFFRPYLAKHESDIDRNLFELKTRAGDVAVLYWQRAASYGQTRILDILQYVAAQSTPRPRPAQQQRATNRKPKTPPASEEPLSPASPASSSDEEEEAHEVSTSQAPPPPPPTAVLNAQKATAAQPNVGTSSPSRSSKAETKQVTTVSSSSPPSEDPPAVKETPMEEAVRVTRGRLRKTRSAGTR